MLKEKYIETITYRKKSTQGFLLQCYTALYDLKKKPLFATDKDGNFISEKTRRSHGCIYIPIDELKSIDTFYIIHGRKNDYKKYIVKIIELTSNIIKYDIECIVKRGTDTLKKAVIEC
jgi:hypothetical protein